MHGLAYLNTTEHCGVRTWLMHTDTLKNLRSYGNLILWEYVDTYMHLYM